MTNSTHRKESLGRGLDALFQESSAPTPSAIAGEMTHLKTFRLKPNPHQPRQRFSSDDLESLVNSIREKGILQPLLVRPHPQDKDNYEIIAGERRWRAAKTLNLEEVPVIVRECSNSESLELAIIENVQRHNLDPIEEAEGFQRLIEEFSYTQEQLAKVIGKSRSHIANTVRLLQLPESIKKLVSEGKITAGHARALLSHPNPETLVDRILLEGMNVRMVEQKVKETTTKSMLVENEHTVQELEISQNLTQVLGLKTVVKIGRKGGTLTIHFGTFEQMDDIITKLQKT
ncbi:MAG: ParB/RepB/Spo0J family partition protein [Alphaproteobacteria bacterium]